MRAIASTGCASALSLSLEYSASQVSPQVLSLMVLHPRIPDEPPEMRALSCVSLSVSDCGGFGFVGHAQACLEDLWLSCTWPRFIFSDAHSAGDAASHPAGLLTARVAKTVAWLPCSSSSSSSILFRNIHSWMTMEPKAVIME